MNGEAVLYLNGTVHTMRPGVSPADALLVRGDRVVAVGSREELHGPAAGARRVDLGGSTVIPGFNDSHAHLLSFGLTLQQLDVSADAVHSVTEISAAVGRRASETAAGAWVHGRGYNQNELSERRHVTRHDLDPVSADRPVVLDHTSGHVLVCNSAALHLAGVTAGTADPPAGEIERDDSGEPTGLLKEAAMDLVRRVMPDTSHSEGRDAILQAMETLATFGITSASDAWTGRGPSLETELAMYRAAHESGKLAARLTLMPLIAHVAPEGASTVRRPDEFDLEADPLHLAIGPTKIFADGALSTRTAAMRLPYADDPANRGILLWEPERLAAAMRRAHGAGWQIATHALGDRAVEMVLSCYAAAMTGLERADHRHRIEHCMYADEGLVRRIRGLGIVPSLQPDIYRLGDAYVAALGPERAFQSIPTGLFRRFGVEFAFSSDLPVIPGRPLDVIRSAMERRTPRGIELGPEHAVPAMEAVRAYTWGGAFATHTEGQKGMLAPGLLADFVVLTGDPARTSLADWDGLRVLKTVLGGTETYAA